MSFTEVQIMGSLEAKRVYTSFTLLCLRCPLVMKWDGVVGI